MTRLTCHRYAPADDARAAEVAHGERPAYLRARGWTSVRSNIWSPPGDQGITFSTAAAIREALRQEVAK